MTDRAAFFAHIRALGLFGDKLEQSVVEGTEAILDAMAGVSVAHCAYALATALHETNRTMQPVREAYWLSEAWRRTHLRYYPWYGRGFVQLTWQANYAKADRELNLGGLLTTTPDAAMRVDIAARIMRLGMVEGWFTGKKLADYLPSPLGTLPQFKSARRIVNGTDKADLIATYAKQFQDALVAGQWP